MNGSAAAVAVGASVFAFVVTVRLSLKWD